MGRWKKSKTFNPPTLQGFKKKEGAGPIFNFSDHLIDAISYKTEKEYDEQQFEGRFNEAFLDEYGFTMKKRDTTGDIIFKPAENQPREDTMGSFSDIHTYGDIHTDHVMEIDEPEEIISEDKETGEKDIIRPNIETREAKTAQHHVVDINKDNYNNTSEQKLEVNEKVTSDSKMSVDSVISMDLDELYKDTHLPEKEKPVKRGKVKNKKPQRSKQKDEVVDLTAESPFKRSYKRPAPEPPAQIQIHDNHVSGSSPAELPQVHSNGSVPKEANNNDTSEPDKILKTNSTNSDYDFAQVNDDLTPITGNPASQTFESNVPKLSAHKLALMASQYRSSKYKLKNPVEKRKLRNSIRESKELKKLEKEDIARMYHPTQNVVPKWAKQTHSDNTLKYTFIGVLVALVIAAIIVPLLWAYTGSDDSNYDSTTLTADQTLPTTSTPSSVT